MVISFAELFVALVALFGHAVLWLAVNNRLHAMPLQRSHIKAISALSHTGSIAVLGVFGWWLWQAAPSDGDWLGVLAANPTALFYFLLCIGMAIVHLPRWPYVRFAVLGPAWRHGRTLKVLDAVKLLGRHPTRGIQFAVGRRVPLNQVMQVEITEKIVPLPTLPESLDGLRILHLSDLHFSGRVDPEFFELVFDELNSLSPDVIALTGDVCDKAECLPWIEPLLSRLSAKLGTFFVFGNHDRRLTDLQVRQLRDELSSLGWIDVSAEGASLVIGDARLQIGGNELPWFPRASTIPGEMNAESNFKLLLSHSPDQIRWARRHGYQLMLTGHTHGGQIRAPIIGPTVCPSWYGVHYASGLFIEPELTLHVVRGLSGLFPIRLNCRPEVTMLELRRQAPKSPI